MGGSRQGAPSWCLQVTFGSFPASTPQSPQTAPVGTWFPKSFPRDVALQGRGAPHKAAPAPNLHAHQAPAEGHLPGTQSMVRAQGAHRLRSAATIPKPRGHDHSNVHAKGCRRGERLSHLGPLHHPEEERAGHIACGLGSEHGELRPGRTWCGEVLFGFVL